MANYWENYYSSKDLDSIPWNRTQADWFKHSIDSVKIIGKTALDLGCGTGKKSIYLAKNGFEKAVGVDISPSAIEIAKRNAEEENISNISFEVCDITDLSFLGNEKFDFVLDWAALHCISEDKMPQYVSEVAKHTQQQGILMLRVFSNHGADKDYFIDEINGEKSKVTLLSEEKIEQLYSPYFKITHSNKSKPRTHDNLIFVEFLMKRK